MGLSKILDEAEIEALSDTIKEKLENRLQSLQTQTDELKAKYEKVCVNSGKFFVYSPSEIAEWLAHWLLVLEVPGSIPAGGEENLLFRTCFPSCHLQE